jgi:hypothetical protein
MSNGNPIDHLLVGTVVIMGRWVDPNHPWWRLNPHRRFGPLAAPPGWSPFELRTTPHLCRHLLSSSQFALTHYRLPHTHCTFKIAINCLDSPSVGTWLLSLPLGRTLPLHSWSHSSTHSSSPHSSTLLQIVRLRSLGWGAELHVAKDCHNPQPCFQQLVVSNAKLSIIL